MIKRQELRTKNSSKYGTFGTGLCRFPVTEPLRNQRFLRRRNILRRDHHLLLRCPRGTRIHELVLFFLSVIHHHLSNILHFRNHSRVLQNTKLLRRNIRRRRRRIGIVKVGGGGGGGCGWAAAVAAAVEARRGGDSDDNTVDDHIDIRWLEPREKRSPLDRHVRSWELHHHWNRSFQTQSHKHNPCWNQNSLHRQHHWTHLKTENVFELYFFEWWFVVA